MRTTITALMKYCAPRLTKQEPSGSCCPDGADGLARGVEPLFIRDVRPRTVQTAHLSALQRFFQHVRLRRELALPLSIRFLAARSWRLHSTARTGKSQGPR